MDIDQVKTYGTEGDLIAILDLPLSALVDTFFIPWDLDGEEEVLRAQR